MKFCTRICKHGSTGATGVRKRIIARVLLVQNILAAPSLLTSRRLVGRRARTRPHIRELSHLSENFSLNRVRPEQGVGSQTAFPSTSKADAAKLVRVMA